MSDRQMAFDYGVAVRGREESLSHLICLQRIGRSKSSKSESLANFALMQAKCLILLHSCATEAEKDTKRRRLDSDWSWNLHDSVE